LDNWDKFKSIKKFNVTGFFIDCVKNEYQIPKKQSYYRNSPQYDFEQREYSEEDYEKFYSN